jgi:hypothetical protein
MNQNKFILIQVAARKDINPKVRGDLRTMEKALKASEDELKFLVELNHPNVIDYLAHEYDANGQLHIYTEYCEFRDLQTHITEFDNGEPFSDGFTAV